MNLNELSTAPKFLSQMSKQAIYRLYRCRATKP